MSAALYVGLSPFGDTEPVRVRVVREYRYHTIVRFPGKGRDEEVHPDALRPLR